MRIRIGSMVIEGRRLTPPELASNADSVEALRQWMLAAGKATTDGAICRHVLKHASELFTDVGEHEHREQWAASMRNLIEIYEAKHKIEPSTGLRLARMMLKYDEDPANHVKPPAIPSTTPAERAAAKKAKESWGGS
jgi:hypothetical protein